MENQNSERIRSGVRPFDIRDKLGYAAGDIANNMTFMLASSFLMIFYTEVLFIEPAAVGTLFIVARVVDAFTDITMGKIVDKTPATEEGKFRPWLKRGAFFVAFASFLMYQSYMVNFPMTVRLIYMYITYLLWGSIAYTCINIPYGSMAAAVSPNPEHRTELSVFRGAGATVANMILGAIVPIFIYGTDAAGNEIVRGGWVFPAVAGVMAILAILFYFVNYSWTKERVIVDAAQSEEAEHKSLGEELKEMFSVLKSRSLISIMAASVLLLMVLISMNQLIGYLFPFYYGSSRGISITMIVQPALSLIIVYPLSSAIAKKIGIKEAGASGMVLGAIAYFTLYFVRPESMYTYIAIAAVGYVGMSVLNATVWAAVTDVIDDYEVETYNRADGTIYGVNSFSRKVGQALAGGIAGWALTLIGYDQTAAVQSQQVLDNLFNVTVLVPAIGFTLTALILIFWYPLSKKKTKENTRILRERANNQ